MRRDGGDTAAHFVRDSKDPGGPQLGLTHEAARDLVRRLRGEQM
ncbi:DUF397 domain-containing protein [Actinomadura madurae]